MSQLTGVLRMTNDALAVEGRGRTDPVISRELVDQRTNCLGGSNTASHSAKENGVEKTGLNVLGVTGFMLMRNLLYDK
jgi:hypothetical protein